MSPTRRSATIFWATLVALAAFNDLRGVGALGDLADALAVALAFAVAGLAVWGGMSLADLGLARDTWRSGVRWGLGVLVLVLAVVIVGALVPATSDFLNDARADVPALRLVTELVVGSAIGTVIPEELLFRGVLLGSAMGRWGRWPGLAAASVVFGLWHVFPTLGTAGGNAAFAGADASTPGRIGLVGGAVVATSIAGAIFGWLRIRSGSLLAPMIAHLSTNGVALVVAWFVVHRP